MANTAFMDKMRGLESRFGGKNRNVGKTERWMSALGGAALTAFALKRRSKGSIGLALAGLPLLMRGATGHCQLYQALGIDHGRSAGSSTSQLAGGQSAFVPAGVDAASASLPASGSSFSSPGTPGLLGPQAQDETGRDPIGQNF